MQGKWKDGSPMMYGGDGVAGHPGVVGPQCKFMFPYDSDPYNWGTDQIVPGGGYTQNNFYWCELTGDNGMPNPVGDRRGLASSGPFTFASGTVQVIDRAYITCWLPVTFSTVGMDEWATYIKEYFLNNLYNK